MEAPSPRRDEGATTRLGFFSRMTTRGKEAPSSHSHYRGSHEDLHQSARRTIREDGHCDSHQHLGCVPRRHRGSSRRYGSHIPQAPRNGSRDQGTQEETVRHPATVQHLTHTLYRLKYEPVEGVFVSTHPHAQSVPCPPLAEPGSNVLAFQALYPRLVLHPPSHPQPSPSQPLAYPIPA